MIVHEPWISPDSTAISHTQKIKPHNWINSFLMVRHSHDYISIDHLGSYVENYLLEELASA